ncbi:MAG: transketolase C-terminal domain-containing protein [Promethearchaeota archaeon]
MSDAYLGHLHEVVQIPSKEEILKRVKERTLPDDLNQRVFSWIDTKTGDYIIPEAPIMGTDYAPGLFLHQPHGPDGLPTPKPMVYIKTIMEKILSNKDKICLTDKYRLDDAEIIVIAYGLPVRSSYRAVDIARNEGIKVGVFRLTTVWPFPDEQVKKVVKDAKAVICPELNYTGIIAEQVERVTSLNIPVIKIPKVAEFHHPDDILKVIKEVAK